MNDFGTEFEQKGVIGGDILYIAMHALCNKEQSITFTGHLKYALDYCFIFQGQFFHFCSIHRDREVEDNLPNPVAIRLLIRE